MYAGYIVLCQHNHLTNTLQRGSHKETVDIIYDQCKMHICIGNKQ